MCVYYICFMYVEFSGIFIIYLFNYLLTYPYPIPTYPLPTYPYLPASTYQPPTTYPYLHPPTTYPSTYLPPYSQGSEEYHEMQTSIKEFINFHHIPKTMATRLVESHQHKLSYTNGIDMNSVSSATST